MPRHSQANMRGATLALALVWLATPAQATDRAPVQQELQGVQKALKFGRAAEALRQKEAARLQAETRELQQRLVSAADKSRDLEQAMVEAEERLSDLIVQTEAARFRLQSREADVATTLTALVRLQRQPPVALLLHHDSIVGAARGNRLLARAIPHLRDDTADLRQELLQLASLQQKTEAERQRVHGAVAAWEDQKAAIGALLKQRQERVRTLAGDSRREQERLDKLAERAGSLAGLLKQLEADEARRRREEEERLARIAAAERARRAAEQAAAAQARAQAEVQAKAEARARAEAEAEAQRRAAEKPPTVAPRLAFSAARGRLTLPVRGRVIRKYGERDDVGSRSQGLTLLTRADAEVVAPHDGHIAFSGPFRDYGVILIIAHGEGYHTLLAGLAEAYVEVGQTLLAGEPVGHMGNGKSRTLYVELRRNGEAINPHPWWASNGGKVSG